MVIWVLEAVLAHSSQSIRLEGEKAGRLKKMGTQIYADPTDKKDML